MTEFEKWQNNRAVKTIGWINNSDAYKAGEKAGWKAALEWALGPAKENCYEPMDWCDNIYEELEQLNQSNSQSDNSPQSNTPS